MEHLFHFVKNLKEIGAIAPSSKFLARDLARQLDSSFSASRKPLNMLEIGAGTGPLTKRLAKRLKPDDHLDVVELNDRFYKQLSREYDAPNINIEHGDILEFNPGYSYDIIFSSLPYEGLPKEISHKIWVKKLQLCGELTYITYYKYLNVRQFKCKFEKTVVDRYKRDSNVVFLNVPPAKRFTLRINRSELPDSLTEYQVEDLIKNKEKNNGKKDLIS